MKFLINMFLTSSRGTLGQEPIYELDRPGPSGRGECHTVITYLLICSSFMASIDLYTGHFKL